MKRLWIFLIIIALVSISVSLMADIPHYPWRGCQCQRRGARAGHCHCPDQGKSADTYCRYDGNHWIRFPFRRRRSISDRQSHDRAHEWISFLHYILSSLLIFLSQNLAFNQRAIRQKISVIHALILSFDLILRCGIFPFFSLLLSIQIVVWKSHEDLNESLDYIEWSNTPWRTIEPLLSLHLANCIVQLEHTAAHPERMVLINADQEGF